MFAENSAMILLWWPQRTAEMWYNIPALFTVWGGFCIGESFFTLTLTIYVFIYLWYWPEIAFCLFFVMEVLRSVCYGVDSSNDIYFSAHYHFKSPLLIK